MSLEPWERWKRENEKKKTKINMALSTTSLSLPVLLAKM